MRHGGGTLRKKSAKIPPSEHLGVRELAAGGLTETSRTCLVRKRVAFILQCFTSILN